MELEIRLVHWYDTERRRIACGARSGSTKHVRAVTCTACLAQVAEAQRPTGAGYDGVHHVN
jgi:hypothetical protein